VPSLPRSELLAQPHFDLMRHFSGGILVRQCPQNISNRIFIHTHFGPHTLQVYAPASAVPDLTLTARCRRDIPAPLPPLRSSHFRDRKAPRLRDTSAAGSQPLGARVQPFHAASSRRTHFHHWRAARFHPPARPATAFEFAAERDFARCRKETTADYREWDQTIGHSRATQERLPACHLQQSSGRASYEERNGKSAADA